MKRVWREEVNRELRGERVRGSKRRESIVAMRATFLTHSISAKTKTATMTRAGKAEAVKMIRRRALKRG